jgi:hypothetical protein
VSRGERKVVFQTALEQAQQQYTAAAAVGYESRPLNLFYGLSQAGKALAAASPHLDQSQPDPAFKTWRTSSHGLTFSPVGGATTLWQQRVKLDPGNGDAFSRASIALDSARDFESIELGALAAQVPEFVLEWRKFGPWPHSLHAGDAMSNGSEGVFDLRDFDRPRTVQAVESYAAAYPALAGYEMVLDDDGMPAHRTDDGFPYIRLPAESVTKVGPYRYHPTKARAYGAGYLVVPSPDGSAGDLHPLMAWWLLLFGFSILARYHPKEWTEALALGTSPYASQVEFLLDAAVSSVPELLARDLWTPPA